MRVTLIEFNRLTLEQRKLVTHVVAETEQDLWSQLICDRGYADQTVKPGSGLDDRGFNR